MAGHQARDIRRAVKAGAIVIVATGLALAAGVGVRRGFDVVSGLIFVLLVALGVLALRVATASTSGRVVPGRCAECGGLISPNAPYCKHCGAQRH